MPKRTKKPLTAAALKDIWKNTARRGNLPNGCAKIPQSAMAKKYHLSQPTISTLLKKMAAEKSALKGDKPAVAKADKTTVKTKPASKAKAGALSSFEAVPGIPPLSDAAVAAVRAMLAEWAAPLPEFQSPFVKEFGRGSTSLNSGVLIPPYGTVTITSPPQAPPAPPTNVIGRYDGSTTTVGSSSFDAGVTLTNIPGDAPGAFEHKNGATAKETT